MIRSTVCAVDWVCSVAKTRWPVSAAVSAVEIVSRSRISPTRITSGSWRSAARSASAKSSASAPISRWLTMHFLWRCRNSIGSSIVRMCSSRSLLIMSSIAASVVVLPEPVGPVTRTKPRGLRVNSSRTGGSPSASRLWISCGMWRKAALIAPRWKKTVDAEAGDAGDRVGEVELLVVLEALALVVVEDRVDDLAGLLRGQRRIVLQRRDPPAHADGGREPGGQVHVGCPHLDHPGQHLGEIECPIAQSSRSSGLRRLSRADAHGSGRDAGDFLDPGDARRAPWSGPSSRRVSMPSSRATCGDLGLRRAVRPPSP